MSQYKSSWPADQQHDPAYVSFFEKFYKVSDTPDAHDDYADSFTSDATVIMASKKVEGRDGR
ncbi:L-2-aminoadipate reductase [Elsinoe australis]|uniref:L-2-aminoadipate reductase n=1 Tax=Elsinoe australis TaxID=40998 RepID=A0A2P7YQ87_9PEZI|nr:L-2-aminoadipate reductase [Elsinoe australis]